MSFRNGKGPMSQPGSTISDVTLDWGSVPDWFAAVGTVGALGASAVAISRSTSVQREQQNEAQWDEAFKVTVDAREDQEDRSGFTADRTTTVIITNGGRRAIYDVTLHAFNADADLVDHRTYALIPPGRNVDVQVRWDEEAFYRTGADGTVEVLFMDVAGGTWTLDNKQMLTRLSQPQSKLTRRRHRWKTRQRGMVLGTGE
jgi:hypothetical protein